MQVSLAMRAGPASRDTHMAPSQGDGSVLSLNNGWTVVLADVRRQLRVPHFTQMVNATPQTLQTKAEAVFWQIQLRQLGRAGRPRMQLGTAPKAASIITYPRIYINAGVVLCFRQPIRTSSFKEPTIR